MSTCGSTRRSRTERKSTKVSSRTEYAVCYADDTDWSHDFGVYCTFATRGAALDYATDMVFERAKNLEVKVLDSEDWKTEMTRAQVRAQLGEGYAFQLVTEFVEYPGCDPDPDEYVSICVTEIEHYER